MTADGPKPSDRLPRWFLGSEVAKRTWSEERYKFKSWPCNQLYRNDIGTDRRAFYPCRERGHPCHMDDECDRGVVLEGGLFRGAARPPEWAGAGPLLKPSYLVDYEASWSRTKRSALGRIIKRSRTGQEIHPGCVGALVILGDAGRMLLGPGPS